MGMARHDVRMAYPQKLLSEGETVVLDLHTHWKVMFWPTVELLLTLGIAGYLIGGIVTTAPASSSSRGSPR